MLYIITWATKVLAVAADEVKGTVKWPREGGVTEWYQSIGLLFIYAVL
jgi:hypothetical protein